MRHTIDLIVPPGIAVAVMVTAISAYNGFNERRDLAGVVEQSRTATFNLSCASDGSLDERNSGNCFEKNGYRFIREGLGTIIAKVASNGSAEIIYRHHTADDGGSRKDLRAAHMALNNT